MVYLDFASRSKPECAVETLGPPKIRSSERYVAWSTAEDFTSISVGVVTHISSQCARGGVSWTLCWVSTEGLLE